MRTSYSTSRGIQFAQVEYGEYAYQVKTHPARHFTSPGCPKSATILQDSSRTPTHDTRRRTESVRATQAWKGVNDSAPERPYRICDGQRANGPYCEAKKALRMEVRAH